MAASVGAAPGEHSGGPLPDADGGGDVPEEKRPVVTRVPYRGGDVLRLTRAASPQFVAPITVRVIRELVDRHPPYGWVWVEAYQLGVGGQATARRELFLMPAGAVVVPRSSVVPAARRPIRRTPVRAGA